MFIKLSDGQKLEVFITHVSPKLSYEQLINSPNKHEAALYLGGVDCNGTVTEIFDGNRKLGIGTASLHYKDSFQKHRGVQISLSRALQQAGFPKPIRKEIWEQVFSGKFSKKS